MKRLLFPVLFGAITFLALWAATQFGIDPNFAIGTWALIVAILIFVPMRVTTESSTVFPGTPEQLFELASDIKLSLQVLPNQRRRLLSVTGQPGQPGSNYALMTGFGGVMTTTVVSSDPPRKIVVHITGPWINNSDVERTYTPVAGGTLLEARVRQRMALLSWLRRPAFKRGAEAEAARANALIRDYLAAGVANTGGVGN